MSLLKRISQLITANINSLLDQAEDPEVMVKQIIRDMEESIIELRRETVRAVAREKQLEKQIIAAEDLAKDLGSKAKVVLEQENETLAKQMLTKKLDTESRKEILEKELEAAKAAAAELKQDLLKLEDQVQIARRKKEELIRRKRAAESKLQTQNIRRKSIEAIQSIAASIASFDDSAKNLETYEDAIRQLEAEAEATQEILELEKKDEIDLDKMEKEKRVEDELAKLKKSLKKDN